MLSPIYENEVVIDIPILEVKKDRIIQKRFMIIVFIIFTLMAIIALACAHEYPLLSAYLILLGIVLVVISYAYSLQTLKINN